VDWRDDEGPGEHDLEPDEEDVGDDPEDDQLPCPSCGRMIFDDADRCPYCGDWIMPLAAATACGRGTWVWWTALVLAVVLLITWGLFG